MKRFLLGLVNVIMACAILNEIRGLIMAGPVIYALYLTGGTWMALWLAFCSLAGIAASVIIPMWAAKKLKARLA